MHLIIYLIATTLSVGDQRPTTTLGLSRFTDLASCQAQLPRAEAVGVAMYEAFGYTSTQVHAKATCEIAP